MEIFANGEFHLYGPELDGRKVEKMIIRWDGPQSSIDVTTFTSGTDVNGKTFVAFTSLIAGRILNIIAPLDAQNHGVLTDNNRPLFTMTTLDTSILIIESLVSIELNDGYVLKVQPVNSNDKPLRLIYDGTIIIPEIPLVPEPEPETEPEPQPEPEPESESQPEGAMLEIYSNGEFHLSGNEFVGKKINNIRIQWYGPQSNIDSNNPTFTSGTDQNGKTFCCIYIIIAGRLLNLSAPPDSQNHGVLTDSNRPLFFFTNPINPNIPIIDTSVLIYESRVSITLMMVLYLQFLMVH